MPKRTILRLAEAVGDDLHMAERYYEVFVPTGRDRALIDRVNRIAIFPGFNVVSEALHLGVIAALCRIWDKQRDAARFPGIARRLGRNPGLVSEQAELTQWLTDVDEVQSSEALAALRGFRNVGQAHRSDPNSPDPRSKRGERRVLHGDERAVLEATISIMSELNRLLGVSPPDDPLKIWSRSEWKKRAAQFWGAVATTRAGSSSSGES